MHSLSAIRRIGPKAVAEAVTSPILAVLNRPTWHKKTKGHLKYPKVLTNGKQLMPSRQQLQQNNQLLQVLKFFGASEAHRRPSMPCPSKCSGSCTSHENVQLDGAVNYLIPSGPRLHGNSCWFRDIYESLGTADDIIDTIKNGKLIALVLLLIQSFWYLLIQPIGSNNVFLTWANRGQTPSDRWVLSHQVSLIPVPTGCFPLSTESYDNRKPARPLGKGIFQI